MLTHLIGDSTQPFHCGHRNDDNGANKVQVYFGAVGPDGKLRPLVETNLHAIWDDLLIDLHSYSWGSYAAALERDVISRVDAGPLDDGFAVRWIEECHDVARTLYGWTPEGTYMIGPDYQADVQPILDRQLATGGVRLAALLNKLLGGH